MHFLIVHDEFCHCEYPRDVKQSFCVIASLGSGVVITEATNRSFRLPLTVSPLGYGILKLP